MEEQNIKSVIKEYLKEHLRIHVTTDKDWDYGHEYTEIKVSVFLGEDFVAESSDTIYK